MNIMTENKPKIQDHEVHLRDDDWGSEIGSPYSPFPSKESASEFARHWVYRHGETASATIYMADDPEMNIVEDITFEDVVCGCGCGEEVAVVGGFASPACRERALIGVGR